MNEADPAVGIIMGSQSDWETMRHAAEMLDRLSIPHEAKPAPELASLLAELDARIVSEGIDEGTAEQLLLRLRERHLRRQTADVIGILVPPKGTFTASFVKLHHEVRLREAEVQADSARRNDRPGAVVHLAIGLILGETVMDELSYEGA